MLKILYVIDQKPEINPGGIEYHLLDLVNGCLGRKCSVYVMFPECDNIYLRYYKDYRIEEFRYSCRQLSDHQLRDLDIEAVFSNILEDIDVEIVHFQSMRTLPLSLIDMAKQKKKKVVLTLHEYYFWCVNATMLAPNFCWFEKDEETCYACLTANNYSVSKEYIGKRRRYLNYLFSRTDSVIVPSIYVKDVCMCLYDGLSEDRCVVIENGINKDLLREKLPEGNNSSSEKLSLAFLGKFLRYKGNRVFLELIRHYKNSHNVFFSIIGHVPDASLIPPYNNLNVLGSYTRDNVVDFIHKANPDIILLLSNWPETFSYTLSEAIASATPVIATDSGALRDRVSKEKVGFLVPVEEPLPRTIEIIEDIRKNPHVLSYFRERVREARDRLKTADEMVIDHFRVYMNLQQKADELEKCCG
jgi:glycosyltransferase involved in cell wall biosynthesis